MRTPSEKHAYHHILVVDDDPYDRELTALAFQDACPTCRLTFAGSGPSALALLRGGVHPDLILLDVHMPGMNGFDLLEVLRADPFLGGISVVVLTTSGAERDRERARALQAHGYLVKATGLQAFARQIGGLVQGWGVGALPALISA